MTSEPSATKGWVDGLAHWRDEEAGVAFLSIAFTWKVCEAVRLAEYYRQLGFRVCAGGPALFTVPMQHMMRDVAELEPDGVGLLPDAIRRHNPLATTASRGCPVACWYCIVPAMEGTEFTLLPDFVPRPILTDNNLSALPPEYQQHIVDRYIGAGVQLRDANSGFEPKTFDEEVLRRWQPINRGVWRFGLDETQETEDVRRVIAMLKRHGVAARRIQVYVMIGHEPFAQCMDRIRRVLEWGGEPYVQPVMKLNARVKKPWVRHDWTPKLLGNVQRWANGHIWRKTGADGFALYDANVRTNPRREPGRLV